MQCNGCGAELDFREVFCSKCGELTNRGKGPGELAGRYAAELAYGFGRLTATALAYVTNPENRKKVGIGAGVALLLLISMTTNPISRGFGSIFTSTSDAPAFNDDGTPNFAEYEDVFIGEQVEYFATSSANIRDFPTSQGTSVIGALAEGEMVMAREVQAFDSNAQWLKLSSGGYVWASNLIVIEDSGYDTGSTESDAVGVHDFFGAWRTTGNCNSESGDTLTITQDGASYGPSFYQVDDTYYEGAIRFVHPRIAGQPEDFFFLSKVRGEPGIWMGVTSDHTSQEYFFFDAKAPCSVVNSFNPYP